MEASGNYEIKSHLIQQIDKLEAFISIDNFASLFENYSIWADNLEAIFYHISQNIIPVYCLFEYLGQILGGLSWGGG